MMSKKLLSLAIGAALTAGLSAANADEPLALTEAQMDGVTAGTGFTTFVEYTKILNIDEVIFEVKNAEYVVATTVVDFSAGAQATADATGPNADAQTWTNTQIDLVGEIPGTGVFLYQAGSLSKSLSLVSP